MAVHLLGLKDVLDRPAADLSQGRRRLVALARAIASGPSVLLLDEPAAGLDTDESVELGEQLRKLAAEGVGILLVDHDMGLVLSACDWITVIDFGRLLAAGTPAQVRVDKAVLDAYLGVS
jgi:sulfate-transporting ATPase